MGVEWIPPRSRITIFDGTVKADAEFNLGPGKPETAEPDAVIGVTTDSDGEKGSW